MPADLYQQHGVPHPGLFNDPLAALQSLDSAWVVIGRISESSSIGIWGRSIVPIGLYPTAYSCDGSNWIPSARAYGAFRESFNQVNQWYANKAYSLGRSMFPSVYFADGSTQGWMTTASGDWPDPPSLWPTPAVCNITPYPYHLECIEEDYPLWVAPGAWPLTSGSFIGCYRAGTIDHTNTNYSPQFSIVGYPVTLNKDLIAQAPAGIEILEAYIETEWTNVAEQIIDHEFEVLPCGAGNSSSAPVTNNSGSARLGLQLMGRRLNSASATGPGTSIDGSPTWEQWNLTQYNNLGNSHEYQSIGGSAGITVTNGKNLMNVTRMVQAIFDNRHKPLGDVYLWPDSGNAPSEISNASGLVQFARGIRPEINTGQILTSGACPSSPGYEGHLKTQEVSWDSVEFHGPILARIRLNSSTDFDALNLVAGAMYGEP